MLRINYIILYVHHNISHHIHREIGSNCIGDIGMQAFASAIAMGSLPACKMILVEDENPGNAAPLKAACEERGIACM